MVQTHGGAGSPGHSLHVFRLHPLARGKVWSKTLHNYQRYLKFVETFDENVLFLQIESTFSNLFAFLKTKFLM